MLIFGTYKSLPDAVLNYTQKCQMYTDSSSSYQTVPELVSDISGV